MTWTRASLTIGLLALLTAGCANRGSLRGEFYTKPTTWPYARGNAAATGALDNAGFSGRLTLLWEVSVPDKPAGPLTIYHDALMFAGTKKRLRVYDLSSGKKLMQYKLGGVPQTGIVMEDSLSFYAIGPPRDRLHCVDLARRKRLWSQPVKDASAGSIIVSNRLIIGSADGTVASYDLRSGKEVWSRSLDGKCVAPASYADGTVFQATDRDFLYGLSVVDGKERFHVSLKGPVEAAAAVDQFVYVTDVLGDIYSISADSGRIVWEVRLEGPLWTSPAVSGDRLVAAHSGGEVVALDRTDGKRLWSYSTVDVVAASPLIVGEYVVAGTMSGTLVVLKLSDGTLVSKVQLSSAVAQAPVTDGRRIVVATEDGKIRCYGDRNDGITESHNGGSAQNLAQ
jgi:outer membrane protein assembly factor BamB